MLYIAALSICMSYWAIVSVEALFKLRFIVVAAVDYLWLHLDCERILKILDTVLITHMLILPFIVGICELGSLLSFTLFVLE